MKFESPEELQSHYKQIRDRLAYYGRPKPKPAPPVLEPVKAPEPEPVPGLPKRLAGMNVQMMLEKLSSGEIELTPSVARDLAFLYDLHYSLPPGTISGPRRFQTLMRPRWEWFRQLYILTGYNYTRVAHLTDRDHTTILNAMKCLKELRAPISGSSRRTPSRGCSAGTEP